MDRVAYSRALRAAAQVSFVTVMAGCAAADNVDQYPVSKASGSSNMSAPPAPSATGSTSQKPTADAGTDAKAHTDAQVSQLTCDEKLKALFPSGDEAWFTGPAVSSDPALAECCGAKLEALKPADFEGLSDFRKSGCCHVDNVPNVGVACTPWGPPAPPSLIAWLESIGAREAA